MGIPFYFSFLVKNHPSILRKWSQKSSLPIHHFFLDCNSIIYDAVHQSQFLNESHLIDKVIESIENYIETVGATDLVYIAFDGVAPVAKMKQQRERRLKSCLSSTLLEDQGENKRENKGQDVKEVNPVKFNTTAITPGTLFMTQLNEKCRSYFLDETRWKKWKVEKVMVSGSDEPGEGEHKLFAFIRESPSVSPLQNQLVYGLDADLIMLSINHLPQHPNIFLFRETPVFIQSLEASLEPDALYLLDIPELARTISFEMGKDGKHKVESRVLDYIFLCFLLGNDFLPHFPALNIRTGGVDKLMRVYRELSLKEPMIKNGAINWKSVRKLLSVLAQQEEKFIIEEFKLRNKREKMGVKTYPKDGKSSSIDDDKAREKENLPMQDRALEKYIQPGEWNWESRYYQCLLGVNDTEERKKQICTFYLEGLEWTWRYYSHGCVDWRWYYPYSYPPLLKDLIRYTPYFDTNYFDVLNSKTEPVHPWVQLLVVLPRSSLDLLPPPIYEKVMSMDFQNLNHFYPEPEQCTFKWAFCKYFWESHVDLPEIDLEWFEDCVENVKINS